MVFSIFFKKKFIYTIEGYQSIIMFDDNNDLVITSLKKDKSWEKYSLELWINYSKNAKFNIIDIGAYTGIYSLLAAKNSHKIVYSIEPFPENYKILKKNIRLNRLNNVIAINKAMSDFNGIGNLYINGYSKNPSGSSLAPHPKRKTIRTIKVKTITGNRLFKDQKIALVKMDVERQELTVLKGMRSVLIRDKPVCIIEILDETEIKKVYKFFNCIGYKNFFAISDYHNSLLDINSINFEKKDGVLNYLVYP